MAEKPGKKTGQRAFTPQRIFAESDRGILFDILIFLVSIFFMKMLTENFVQLLGAADDQDDQIARLTVLLFFLGIFILPPAGAILKRHHFHERLGENGRGIKLENSRFLFGCFFNPLFYFCLNVVIVSAVITFVMQLVYGKKEPGEAVFVTFVLAGLGFNILQTYLVYRFFIPPKHEPKFAFLKSHHSATLGDLCIFLNILLYQVAWSALWQSFGFGPVENLTDFFGRLFLIVFLALLIYFPARILYLAEDLRRPAAWFTILLANSPLILRVMFGSS